MFKKKFKKKKKKKKKVKLRENKNAWSTINFTITYLQNDRSCDGPHFSKLSH